MSRAAIIVAALALASCVDQKPAVDYGDPTDLNTPTTVGGITAYVVSPRVTEVLGISQIELVVAAWTEPAKPLRVTVSVDGGSSVVLEPSGEDGPEQRYRAPVSLLHGFNNLRIRMATLEGERIRFFDYRLHYAALAPGIRLSVLEPAGGGDACAGVPIPYGVTNATAVCVRGQVSMQSGEAGGIAVAVASGSSTANLTTDGSGAFETSLALAQNTTETIEATVDSSTARVRLVQDAQPPKIQIDNGGSPIATDGDSHTLTGIAYDDHALATVRLESALGVQRVDLLGMAWSTKVYLTTGENSFTAIARDLAGNETTAPVTVVRNRLIVLRAPTANAGGTDLTLDKAALQSLLPNVADQKAIEMVRVPLRPAILKALEAIRDPVAAGLDTSGWGAAEWNLWRLLNMTPDNADLRGTSVEKMLALADAVGIPKARVLADVFDIDVLTTFVVESYLADVLLDQLIASHPNMRDGSGNIIRDSNNNVALLLTLHDALQNLTTVAPRFGKCSGSSFNNTTASPACSGAHPGFLTGASSSVVFEPGFLLTVPVKSNLTQYDGVSASGTATSPGATKDYLFRLEGSQVLEFDFLSDRFSVVGLVDEPKVDLGFLITEATTGSCSAQPCTKAGTVQNAGADATRPGFYRGNSAVWSLAPFTAESIVAEVAYRENHNKFALSYQRTFSYDAGSIDNAATISWNRGWTVITTSGGIGEPPPPHYAWDLLHEVAQVRLHDGGINEGAATTKFVLDQLPIGLTADQLIDQMRPTLQNKQAELSQRLIGSGGLATSGVDLFFVPNPQGGGFFFFRAQSDGYESSPYPYTTPGFFSDAQLTTKVSSTAALPGTTDTTHEKLAVAQGQTLYFKAPDPQGTERVHQLVVTAADATSVTVRVTQVAP